MRDINEILQRLEAAQLDYHRLCAKASEERSNKYANQIFARGVEVTLLTWVLGGQEVYRPAPYIKEEGGKNNGVSSPV